jgi:hypothetical protein
MVYDGLGLYFLLRVFVQGADGVSRLARITVILLAPVAVEMVSEHFRGRNAFAVFGGLAEECEVRGGRVRAQGPFAHSILAGTVGAVCWPMALMLWRENRLLALAGLATTGAIVWASSSSGPIMTSLFILLGLALWRFRNRMSLIRWGAVLGLVVLNVVMQAPVYYLLARIDLTGSSTGWHRAELIHAAITHLGEWWLAGTDYTRHWMPYGVKWSENHIDITNYYIKMGVLGGIPLMSLFIGVLVAGFASVGRALRLEGDAKGEGQFSTWLLGAILFGHAATFFSISYFDQSVVFLYLLLAMIASLPEQIATSKVLAEPSELQPFPEDDRDLCHNC